MSLADRRHSSDSENEHLDPTRLDSLHDYGLQNYGLSTLHGYGPPSLHGYGPSSLQPYNGVAGNDPFGNSVHKEAFEMPWYHGPHKPSAEDWKRHQTGAERNSQRRLFRHPPQRLSSDLAH